MDSRIERFVKNDWVSDFVERKIESYKKNIEKRSHSSCFYLHELSYCSRRIMYRVNDRQDNIQKETFEKQCSYGKWIHIFSQLKGIKVLRKDIVVSDCNYNLYDKVDAILNVNGEIFALKIFKISIDIFEKSVLIPKHAIDVSICSWILETDGGIAMYECEDGRVKCFHVLIDKYIVKQTMEKFSKLRDNKNKGYLPEREHEQQENPECQECEYSKKCWQ